MYCICHLLWFSHVIWYISIVITGMYYVAKSSWVRSSNIWGGISFSYVVMSIHTGALLILVRLYMWLICNKLTGPWTELSFLKSIHRLLCAGSVNISMHTSITRSVQLTLKSVACKLALVDFTTLLLLVSSWNLP